jgi:Asp-tRNA(Asn)/Glu-tRNA(Gln) amidotransferase A subunit family amidase
MGGPIGRTVTDIAIVLDAIVGYDPADPQTAVSVGNIPKSYTDYLQLTGLHGARIGLLTDLLGSEPEEAEVPMIVRGAIQEMNGQGAQVIEVALPGWKDHMDDGTVQNIDFKFDLNAYLASRSAAPVHSLEEIISSGKFHKTLDMVLRNAQARETREIVEYFKHMNMREVLRQSVLKVMADSNLDALAYPTIRRKANLIGEAQQGTNCRLSANSGLPAIVMPSGFTPDGLPVGVELIGRAWSEPQLIKLAYAYEQATHHRRSPTTTPPLSH